MADEKLPTFEIEANVHDANEDGSRWLLTLDPVNGWRACNFGDDESNAAMAESMNGAHPLRANGAADPIATVGGAVVEELADLFPVWRYKNRRLVFEVAD